MTLFKQKHDKNIKCNNNSFVSLDAQHTIFLKEFYDDKVNTIPQLKKERQILQNMLKQKMNKLLIDDIFKLEEEIDTKTEQIQALKNKKRDYFQNNSKLIFDYFENKKNIEQSIPQNEIYLMNNKNKILQSFFKMDTNNNSRFNATTDDVGSNPNDVSNNRTHSNIRQVSNINNNMVMKYLNNVDDKFIDVNAFMFSADLCTLCKKGDLVPYEDEGILICNHCSHTFPYLSENEKPSYKETPKEISFYAYKRLNHFKEVLAQFQAKETTQISQDVIMRIQMQIKKERIQLETLTNEVMREILRKLGYDSKFYEHIPFIKHKMGIKPIIMSRNLEEDLYNDFNELQAPYFRHCPDNRENFLNYNYTAYKLCERRQHYEFLSHFHMIKDRHKLIEHDSIWEKMCRDLGWQYIPTI